MSHYKKNSIDKKKSISLDMGILVGLFCLSVMGSSYIGVHMSGFMLSPYRLVFIISIFYVVIKYYPLRIPKESVAFLKFYFFWVIWGFCSILWAKDTNKALKADIIMVIAVCSMVICNQILIDSNKIQIVLYAISICFIFVTYIGSYEVLTGRYYFVNNSVILARMAIEKYRAPLVFFTNQNDYCLFMIYGIFVSIYVRSILKSGFIRVFYGLTIIVAIWLIIFADSRGCVLSLGIGIFYWIYIKMRHERQKKFWRFFLFLDVVQR